MQRFFLVGLAFAATGAAPACSSDTTAGPAACCSETGGSREAPLPPPTCEACWEEAADEAAAHVNLMQSIASRAGSMAMPSQNGSKVASLKASLGLNQSSPIGLENRSNGTQLAQSPPQNATATASPVALGAESPEFILSQLMNLSGNQLYALSSNLTKELGAALDERGGQPGLPGLPSGIYKEEDESCPKFTGGTCYALKCDQSRGPTTCQEVTSIRTGYVKVHMCICDSNYCARDGKCEWSVSATAGNAWDTVGNVANTVGSVASATASAASSVVGAIGGIFR